MQLTINIPLKADIVNGGFEVSIATDGDSWSKSQLGHYAGKSGVYVHHSNGKFYISERRQLAAGVILAKGFVESSKKRRHRIHRFINC